MIHVCDLIPFLGQKKEEHEKIEELISEIINASNCLIRIDEGDIRSLFQEGGEINALDVSVYASEEGRMKKMMEQINNSAKCFEPYNRVLVYFFFHKNNSLTMAEICLFSDWIESLPGDMLSKFGLSTHSPQTIRAIVLLQRNNSAI